MRFQKESFTEELFEEAYPLLFQHWREIAHYQDIPLDPNLEGYMAANEAGGLRVYTARDNEGVLVGYAVFIVRRNLHYSSSLQAIQDILYIAPTRRGLGGYFIHWCDDRLKEEGVQVVYHHVKEAHNFGALMERLGYELVDHIYARRLDQNGS
jgi:hypothetical protein